MKIVFQKGLNKKLHLFRVRKCFRAFGHAKKVPHDPHTYSPACFVQGAGPFKRESKGRGRRCDGKFDGGRVRRAMRHGDEGVASRVVVVVEVSGGEDVEIAHYVFKYRINFFSFDQRSIGDGVVVGEEELVRWAMAPEAARAEV
jgi:hypothetical protein